MYIYKVRHFPSYQYLRNCPMESTFLWTKRSGRTWSALQFVKKSVQYLFSIKDARFIFCLGSIEDAQVAYIAIEEHDLDSGHMRVLYKIPFSKVIGLPRTKVQSAWGTQEGYEFNLEDFKVTE